MATLPVVNSTTYITRIEVWVTNRSSITENTRNIIAFADLGEGLAGNCQGAPGGYQANYDPDNRANILYDWASNQPLVRGFSNAVSALSSQVTAPGPFQQAIDYEKVENARKLTEQEYTYNALLGYISLNNVYKEMYKNNNISTILKVEAINLLSNCVDYVDDINEYIKDIISNINLDIEFRYKLILSIEHFNLEKDIKMKLINDNLIIILNHKENNIMYRILAGQYLLQNKTNINESSELLYDICVDDTIDFNLRADAADILLSLSTDEYKTKAINIIKYLFFINSSKF
jgi:hypothetical protein